MPYRGSDRPIEVSCGPMPSSESKNDSTYNYGLYKRAANIHKLKNFT